MQKQPTAEQVQNKMAHLSVDGPTRTKAVRALKAFKDADPNFQVDETVINTYVALRLLLPTKLNLTRIMFDNVKTTATRSTKVGRKYWMQFRSELPALPK